MAAVRGSSTFELKRYGSGVWHVFKVWGSGMDGEAGRYGVLRAEWT